MISLYCTLFKYCFYIIRNEDADCSMVSQPQQQPLVQAVPAMPQLPGITLSVRGQQPQPQLQPQQQQQGKKSDASSVANILATRGITVSEGL